MDLSPKTTVTQHADEKLWLGSKHGTDCTETITLDITNGGFQTSDFVAGGDGYSYLKSGIPLKKHAGTGLYRRVVGTAGSEEKADGHLFESVRVKTGTGATTKAGASLLWHGKVVIAKVPTPFVTANQAAAHIRYV